jgi:hypothetical protein
MKKIPMIMLLLLVFAFNAPAEEKPLECPCCDNLYIYSMYKDTISRFTRYQEMTFAAQDRIESSKNKVKALEEWEFFRARTDFITALLQLIGKSSNCDLILQSILIYYAVNIKEIEK